MSSAYDGAHVDFSPGGPPGYRPGEILTGGRDSTMPEGG
jgi:hypothetical protein